MNVWIGIDVCKDELSVWVRPLGAHWTVANSTAGRRELAERLSAWSVQQVLLEATGGYEHEVLSTLTAAGLSVVRINPRRARHFAVALGQQAKTDPLDAAVLAHMAQTLELAATPLPSAAHQSLRALAQRRGQLVAQRDDERRRLHQARHASITASLQRHVRYLGKEIRTLDAALAKATALADATLAAQLAAVPGIGPVTTASLIACLPELGHLDGRTIAALSVIRLQPDFKARYERLRSRGKPAKVALVACMRALIVQLNAMVRDQTPWRMAAA